MLKKQILKVLNNYIRKNRLLTRTIFNVKIGNNNRIHWDFTTIIVKKCLRQIVRPSHKVLEMGTGPFALLAIWLSRTCQCTIHACECNKVYVESALKCIELNNATVQVIRSNLYENSTDAYNVIFFNAVYIPVNRGIADGIDALHEYQTDWCGGQDGLETITRYLTDSKTHLLPGGKLLLGFNHGYLEERTLHQLCTRIGYKITGICSFPLYPSKVLILEL